MPANRGAVCSRAWSFGVRTEQGGAVAVGKPSGQVNPEPREERVEITAPGDGHSHVTHGVFEDQVPANDPGDELAQRGIGVGVRTARLRDHGGQLGVAQRTETAHNAEKDERDDERGAGAVAYHFAGRKHLSCRGGANRREDAGANDGADGKENEVAGAECAPESVQVVAFGYKLRDRLAAEQLVHASLRPARQVTCWAN